MKKQFNFNQSQHSLMQTQIKWKNFFFKKKTQNDFFTDQWEKIQFTKQNKQNNKSKFIVFHFAFLFCTLLLNHYIDTFFDKCECATMCFPSLIFVFHF